VRPQRLLLIVGALGAAWLVGCAVHYRSSTEYRARGYFSIPWTQRVTPASIERGVLSVVPIGTPADSVPGRLLRVGIGGDGLSGYYPDSKSGDAVIRLEYDPRHLTFVQSHYGIMLHFENHALKGVHVERWLTGL
jgi:hypothetical protein